MAILTPFLAQSSSTGATNVLRTMMWTEDAPDMLTTEQWYDDDRRTWKFRVRNHLAEKFISPACGIVLNGLE